jgi:hypothetical protein
MSTAVKRRRGTKTQHDAFTGQLGELTFCTTRKTLVAHDGAQAGGFPLQRAKYAGTNVRDFGAAGDGVTDDTAAIQSALAFANSIAGTYRGRVYLPAGAYLVTASLTLGAGGVGLSKPIVIEGEGQATQIINRAPASNPTFSFKGVGYFTLKQMLLTGDSATPNDGVLIAKDGSGNQCGRFLIEDVICEMAGRGFVLQDTNTGVLRDCKSWPSSNSNGDIVDPVVSAGDKDHGIYMTGGFCNDISIYDFDCQVSTTYKAGACAIKMDATVSSALRIVGGSMEGASAAVTGTGRYSINLANVTNVNIIAPYAENNDIRLSNCRYVTMTQVDQASTGVLTFTGNSKSCVAVGGYFGALVVDAGSDQNVFLGSQFYTGITDNGAETRFTTCSGVVDVIDRGGRPVMVSASLGVAQAMTTAASTEVVCGTEAIDSSAQYNPANGRFTPFKGNYRASITGYLDSVAANKEHKIMLYKNGVAEKRMIFVNGTAGSAGFSVSFNFRQTVSTDYWSWFIYNGDTVNRNLAECYVDFEAIS